ncbi:PAS domain-containing protein [Skermanella mucosa]|uniref:PAS domain-containing protein n=1 Tax=Skermanella mucosa TaxID=1789672 RepID=UPI00192B1819|nr:PAS domain-containing protein [Skermanella mucosa]UEM20969.1 PAS domain-containing protein [Skermanella mucosa]
MQTPPKEMDNIALINHPSRENPFRSVVEGSRMPIVVTDPNQADNPIVFANHAFLDLTGYGLDEIIGQNCRFLQGPDSDPEARRLIASALADRRDIKVEVLNYRKNGTSFWNELYISPIHDQDGKLLYFFGSQLDCTLRRQAAARIVEANAQLERRVEERTRDLEQALRHREVLLHELQHRVKNNLQVMASLIRLQAVRSDSEAMRSGLDNLLLRINALELIYRKLYTDDAGPTLELGGYLAEICETLANFHGPDRGVTMDIRTRPCHVPVETALPLGLILNELVTNSFRHAFADRETGTVRLELEPLDGSRWELRIGDDGIGAAGGLDWENNTNLGLSLVKALANQIRATVGVDGSAGTLFTLTFKAEAADARTGRSATG